MLKSAADREDVDGESAIDFPSRRIDLVTMHFRPASDSQRLSTPCLPAEYRAMPQVFASCHVDVFTVGNTMADLNFVEN